MIASIASIIATGISVAQTAKTLYELGKDIAPQLMALKKIFSGEKITEEELARIRAENDALNAEIEALPD